MRTNVDTIHITPARGMFDTVFKTIESALKFQYLYASSVENVLIGYMPGGTSLAHVPVTQARLSQDCPCRQCRAIVAGKMLATQRRDLD